MLREGKQHPSFQCFSWDFAKRFCVSVGNSLLSCVFQFLQASRVTRRNPFFKKYSQESCVCVCVGGGGGLEMVMAEGHAQ
jgi:hypothetical protein